MTVTLTVRVSDAAGNETVQTHSFETSGATPLSGDVSGTFGDAHIVGDVNLTGDLIIEGLLTGVDTFTLNGNGFQLLFQHGGRPNLAGVEKTAWMRWGDSPVGWQVGDRVAVAPTAVGVYVPSESLWGAARPANSPDVTLVDGSVARPEVVNLTQTIVLKNLRRIHFHEGAGVASLKWLKVLDSGTFGVLSEYPIHFHLNGDNSRGSVLEGVVVEGGKNHAFVPHGSHGISFPGCVAYNTVGIAFWWDKPIPNQNPPHNANNSDDINWDDTLAMWGKPSQAQGESVNLAGYWLGAGQRLSANRVVATCVAGNLSVGALQKSGFHWPENAARTSWDFHDAVAHNNVESGIFVWQNAAGLVNVIDDFVAYRNGYAGINHGAYVSDYQYRGAVLTGSPNAIVQHAKSQTLLLFEDIVADSPLRVIKHNAIRMEPTFYRNCTFSQVVYAETVNGSYNVFEDCGLGPADFRFAAISPLSIIDIREGGVLVHRWQSGAWG